MATAFPSIFVSSPRVFKLYGQTFLYVLPFLLLYTAGQFFVDKWVPVEPLIIDYRFYLNSLLQMAVTSLIFSFVVIAMYGHHLSKTLSYYEMIKNGISRALPVFIAYVLVCLPLFAGLFVVMLLENPQARIATSYIVSGYLFLLLTTLITIILCIYFALAGLFIVNKESGPLQALKQSWHYIQGYWIDTFIILAWWIIITISLNVGLSYLIDGSSMLLVNFLTFPLLVALLLIHNEHIENIKQAP